MASFTDEDGGLDESLYSRQLYVMGREAQHRLQRSRVLITGEFNGLAAEISKNVALAGVHSLHLHDDRPCCVADLSSSFLIQPSDVARRRPRAEACVEGLRELNAHVPVEVVRGKLGFDDSERGYGSFTVVVLVQPSRALARAVDDYCHAHDPPIAVVVTGTYGLYGYVFSDFGPRFDVVDTDGEPPRSGIVVDIDAATGVVTTADDRRHGLEDGDLVRFSGVEGMEGLNELQAPLAVQSLETPLPQADGSVAKVRGLRFGVAPEELRGLGRYTGGGYFEQVKPVTAVTFAPFREAVLSPALVPNRFDDFERPRKLHALLLALWERGGENENQQQCALPSPGCAEDAERVAAAAVRLYGEVLGGGELGEEDAAVLRSLALGASGSLNPMAAYFGGIAAQEVLKACSAKFTPLGQWLHFDAAECLAARAKGSDGSDGSATDEWPTLESLYGDPPRSVEAVSALRHEGQAAVFGRSLQRELSRLRLFLVGAGALGCELLKNLALVGAATAEGELVVTDMDGIEVSNLNRQFLFRAKHVGKMKSVVAAAAAAVINPALNVRALTLKVSPEAEDGAFDDAFWDGRDLVVNALDNVPARLYVDSKCVAHRKPLLESGTLGTKANTLPVVPFLSESYGSDAEANEGAGAEDAAIPACTLHAYPNLIEHTLQWARDAVFERLWVVEPSEGSAFLDAIRVRQQQGQGPPSLEPYLAELRRQPSTTLQRLLGARAALLGAEPADHAEGLFPYAIARPTDFERCVWLSRLRFEELFVNKIELLLAVHPPDKKEAPAEGSAHGKTAFWSGKRRPPSVESFDPADALHMQFVVAASVLSAAVYGIALPATTDDACGRDDALLSLPAHLRRLLPATRAALACFEQQSGISLGAFDAAAAAEGVVIPANEQEEKELAAKRKADEADEVDDGAGGSIEARKAALLEQLGALAASLDGGSCCVTVSPLAFEKDDDTNAHLDVIVAAANIRARSYKIPTVDGLKAKRIVGRIIPAIATTTAMTTGAVMLELYKLAGAGLLRTPDTPGASDETVGVEGLLELFRSSNTNLAVNSYTSFEPKPCRQQLWGPPGVLSKLRRCGRRGDDGETDGEGLAETSRAVENTACSGLIRHDVRSASGGGDGPVGTAWSFSLWSMITLEEEACTVQDLVDFFEENFGFAVTSVATDGDVMLYNDLFGQDDRLECSLVGVYNEVMQKPPTGRYLNLVIDGEFDEEEEDEEDDEEDEDEEDNDDSVPSAPPCRLKLAM